MTSKAWLLLAGCVAGLALSCSTYDPFAGRKVAGAAFGKALAEREKKLLELQQGGLDLQECLAFARANNLELQLAKLHAALSDADMQREWLGMLPTLEVQMGVGMRDSPMYSKSTFLFGGGGIRDSYASSQDKKYGEFLVDLAWSPLDFGLASYSHEQARLGLLDSRLAARRVAQNLDAGVVRGFEMMQAFAVSLPALRSAMLEAATRSGLLRDLYEKKLIDLKLFMDARDLFTRVDEEHRLLSGLADRTSAEFARALGVSPRFRFVLAEPAEQPAETARQLPAVGAYLDAALQQRPEIHQADLRAERARIELEKEWLRLFPNVRLFGDFLYDSNTHLLHSTFWTAGVDIAQDLVSLAFSGTRTAPARAAVEAMQKEQGLAALGILVQVRLAHIELKLAVDRAGVARRLWREAQGLLTLTGKRATKGHEKGIELRRAKVEEARARARYLNHTAEVDVAFARLHTAAGVPIGGSVEPTEDEKQK